MPELPKVRLLLALLLLGPAAEAKAPRFSRPEVTVDVKLGERTRPILPSVKIAQPLADLESVISLRANTSARLEHVQILEQLIASTPDREVEEKGEYLFRLAEVFAAQQRQWRKSAVELGARAEATADPTTRSKLQADATASATKAKDFLLRAVKAYKALVDNQTFRNYPKLDVALFGYGFTLQSGKYMKEARAVYDQLLKNYPNSKYVPEAHLVFGEYFFEAAQLADAEARYRMVLRFPKSDVFAYAAYKLGWVQLQLQRYQEALESFFQVAQTTRSDAKQAAMHRAAVLDFVRAYAEVGKADKARPAFQRVDPAMADEMLEVLAQLYLDQGKLDRASYLHQELIKGTPRSERVCEWQYRIARSVLSMPGATTPDRIREIQNLARLARTLEDTSALPAPQLQECRANATAMASELARAYHNEAQKTRNHETLGHAIRLYQVFVDHFAADPRAADLQYLQAEAMWLQAAGEPNERVQRDRWATTSAAFGAVAKADPKRATLASRAAALAYLNGTVDPTLASGAVPALTQGKPAPATALPKEDRLLVDAIAQFAANASGPRDAELGALRFLEGNLYRRAHQHDKAAAIFVGLIATHPNETFSEAAAVLAIDSLILTQQLDQLLRLADKLAADGAYLSSKPDLANVVKYVRSRSMRR
jgi:TolA-binding protein